MSEFIGGMLAAKAVASISIVVALSLIAERAGPRIAGLLIGLPLGAGMVIVFTGLEQGSAFAAGAAVYMVPGFLTTLVFVYLYAVVAARQNRGGLRAIVAPSLLAHVGYGAAAWLLSQVSLPLPVALPLVAVGLVFTARLMAYLPNTPIAVRVRFGWPVLAFRAGMATTAILLVSGVAGTVGTQWTGILTAYPLTLFPLILVIHITYRGEEVAAVLKHVPMGLGSVISFCLVVTWSLPALGLGWGLALGYLAAAAYLLAYSSLSRRTLRSR